MSITATDSANLNNGSSINSNSIGDGSAGTVALTAGTATLSGASEISSEAAEGATATAGAVTVTTTKGDLTLLGKSRISTNTAADGKAGGILDVITKNGSLVIDENSQISSSTSAGGPAGDINIFAGDSDVPLYDGIEEKNRIDLLNGGQVSSSSTGIGAPGSITVTGYSLKIDSEFVPNPDELDTSGIPTASLLLSDDADEASADDNLGTGIFTESTGDGISKAGGSITINVKKLTELKNEGQISSTL